MAEIETHDYDCGDVGGGWPHPASAHGEQETAPMRASHVAMIASADEDIANAMEQKRLLLDWIRRDLEDRPVPR